MSGLKPFKRITHTYEDGKAWIPAKGITFMGEGELVGEAIDRLALYESLLQMEPAEAALKLCRAEPFGKAEQLQTTWETPESCPRCMEHLSLDWSYCPECGRPTDWAKNEPLTLEELRQMDGEPVWIETGEVSINEQIIGRWEIIHSTSDLRMVCMGGGNGLPFNSYGKTWLAYRQRPLVAEEVRKNELHKTNI